MFLHYYFNHVKHSFLFVTKGRVLRVWSASETDLDNLFLDFLLQALCRVSSNSTYITVLTHTHVFYQISSSILLYFNPAVITPNIIKTIYIINLS
jgi:hypothetical protein